MCAGYARKAAASRTGSKSEPIPVARGAERQSGTQTARRTAAAEAGRNEARSVSGDLAALTLRSGDADALRSLRFGTRGSRAHGKQARSARLGYSPALRYSWLNLSKLPQIWSHKSALRVAEAVRHIEIGLSSFVEVMLGAALLLLRAGDCV